MAIDKNEFTSMVVAERIQRIIYGSGRDTSVFEEVDSEQLSKLLTSLYVGALQDAIDHKEVSESIIETMGLGGNESPVLTIGMYRPDGIFRQPLEVEVM